MPLTFEGTPSPQPVPPLPQWSARADRLRVLIVDDEPDIRTSLREALSGQLDADIVDVSNALDAQRLLSSGRCDIVLLDHMMPGPDGADLLTWMRKQRISARAIVITALPNEVLSASPLMLRGATAVLRKPLDLPRLLDAIHEVMPARPRGGEGAR